MGRLTLTDLIEDYLLLWILLSVGLGIALPRLVVVTRASTLILAVMIGSISLTLSVERFRGIDTRTLGLVLLGHAMMPFVAFGIARGFELSPELTVGFVVLGPRVRSRGNPGSGPCRSRGSRQSIPARRQDRRPKDARWSGAIDGAVDNFAAAFRRLSVGLTLHPVTGGRRRVCCVGGASRT